MLEYFKEHKEKIGYLLSIIAFIFYLLYSAKMSFLSGRIPWEDEAHFWTMVQNCSVFEIFKLMRVEGHMMLWYLVVMPFAKLNFPYPYTMQVINWLFCTTALFIFWKKAPFDNYLKALIILCPIFMKLYAVHARCYSIGICFLFLACSMYKERLKKPYLYFLMLFLAANTSVQGTIGAAALGIPFLCELYRNKLYKSAIWISIMSLLTAVMFYFQFNNFQLTDYDASDTFIRINLVSKFLGIHSFRQLSYFGLRIWELRLFVIALIILLIKYPRILFMTLFSGILGALFFSIVYNPRDWHLAFFVIYLIVIYWIFLEEEPLKKKKILFLMMFFFVGIFLISPKPPSGDKSLVEAFEKYNDEFKNAKVFSAMPPIVTSVVVPSNLYDMNGRNLSRYEGLVTYFDKQAKEYEPECLYKYIDPSKKNYVILKFDTKLKKFSNVTFKKVDEFPYNNILYEVKLF